MMQIECHASPVDRHNLTRRTRISATFVLETRHDFLQRRLYLWRPCVPTSSRDQEVNCPTAALSCAVRNMSQKPECVVRHLTQGQLADRWQMSPRTLERWRWVGEGPRFLKLGGRVIYRLEDVENYEAQQLRDSTTAAPSIQPT